MSRENREKEIEKLKQLSPASLPLNTATSGLSATQIRAKFYNGLLYLYELLEKVYDGAKDGDDEIKETISNIRNALSSLEGIINGKASIGDITNVTNAINSLINQLQNGTFVVDKAIKDGDGNVIKDTYLKSATYNSFEVDTNKVNSILSYPTSTTKYPSVKAVYDCVMDILQTAKTYADDSIWSYTYNSTNHQIKFFDKDGNQIGSTIDLPIESLVVNVTYDSANKAIVITLQNGNTVSVPIGAIISGLVNTSDIINDLTHDDTNKPLSAKQGKVLNDNKQNLLSSSNKLNPAYINTNSSYRFVSDTEKSTWNAKQNAISDLATIRSGASAGATAVQPNAISDMETKTHASATYEPKISSSHKVAASNVSGLSAVATSGSYNDLSNKPDISSTYETKTDATSKLNTAKAYADDSIWSYTYNSTNHQIKFYDKDNNQIGSTIDLPIESLVVSVTYNSVNKTIVITLQNGTTTTIPVSDIVTGLVSSSDIVDNLSSTDSTKVLSAKQGKVLKDSIDGIVVTTNKIANGAVTSIKISDGAVTNAKIANGTIANAKMGFRVVVHVYNYLVRYGNISYNMFVTFTDTALNHSGESLAQILYAYVGADDVIYPVTGSVYNSTQVPVGIFTENDGEMLYIRLSYGNTLCDDDEDWQYINLVQSKDINLW